MTHSIQVSCSTNPKTPHKESLPDISIQLPTEKSKELYVFSEPLIKLYRDNMGRFPVRSHSGNHHIIDRIKTRIISLQDWDSGIESGLVDTWANVNH